MHGVRVHTVTNDMILCYRYYPWEELDTELLDIERVWAWVQAKKGHIEIRSDCVDFWIREYDAVEFVLRWGQMRRWPDLDRCE